MKKISFTIATGLLIILSSCGEEKKKSTEASPKSASETQIQSSIEAKTSPLTYDHEVVVPDLTLAWGFAFLPDGSILITEKGGELIHFKDGEKSIVGDSPEVYVHGQGGFLDVFLHPDYENNGWIYFTYASNEGEDEGGNTALMRAKLQDGKLVEKQELYKATPNTTETVHFGSRIAFDNDGYLYFTIGDRSARDVNPQDITRDGGKTYRLNDDGSIPSDNPFTDQQDAKQAVYSYGHRNAQGMILHPETGEIWLHEHGPQGGDEINIVKKQANYGWPVVSYGINYDGTSFTDKTQGPDFTDPIHYWVPSIAPSGFAFVSSDVYPELKGDLLVGSLKFQYVEHLEMNGESVEGRNKILEGIGRIRDLRQGPDGYIYISVEGTGIVKLLPGEKSSEAGVDSTDTDS